MINDGRLKSSRTKEGKHKIFHQDIYLFEEEKKLKDEIKEINSITDKIINRIDLEIFENSFTLYNKIYMSICEIQNSDEMKEIDKIRKTKLRGTKKEKEEKYIKNSKRIEELELKIFQMIRRMLLNLDEELEGYFKLEDLKCNIFDFERKIKLENSMSLERIIEKIEGD